MELCLKYISYDPNYNYDDEEDNDSSMDQDENDLEEKCVSFCYKKMFSYFSLSFGHFSEQEDYSDDDDVSWKIRRAAAKCLDAIINTRHEMLNTFYSDVSLVLISRFKGLILTNIVSFCCYIQIIIDFNFQKNAKKP